MKISSTHQLFLMWGEKRGGVLFQVVTLDDYYLQIFFRTPYSLFMMAEDREEKGRERGKK